MKQQNRVFIDNSICKMKELFAPFVKTFCALCLLLILNLFSVKMLLSSQNKVFRADPYYIKEMQINWESLIIRDKKFHIEIRALLITVHKP